MDGWKAVGSTGGRAGGVGGRTGGAGGAGGSSAEAPQSMYHDQLIPPTSGPAQACQNLVQHRPSQPSFLPQTF